MSLNPRISVRALMALIVACGLAAWLVRGWLFPNRVMGQHFALIGPIDIDRDGRDDCERLKWIIFRNGGTVDFEMPLTGPTSGALSSRTHWYVTDGYAQWRLRVPRSQSAAISNVLKQARLAGIRPVPIERLMQWLDGPRR
jgi:hypothetical protein